MYPIRTGLTSVGMVGGPVGLQAQDATLAEVLKTQGYATGQFGKNHLGDRNEHLPTVHGFDEFFGSLYHLNTQEAEDEDYPRDPSSRNDSDLAGSCTPGPPTPWMRPSTPASAGSASNESSTPAR
jgi:arylsulfatase A-like enzyme